MNLDTSKKQWGHSPAGMPRLANNNWHAIFFISAGFLSILIPLGRWQSYSVMRRGWHWFHLQGRVEVWDARHQLGALGHQLGDDGMIHFMLRGLTILHGRVLLADLTLKKACFHQLALW
jgi:hypothetical protein